MSVPVDPFAEEVGRGGVPRDRWGHPLLIGLDGKQRAYTSTSSLSNYMTDKAAIETWRRRYLARGLGMRPDLAMLAGSETYNTGFKMDDKDANKASGRRLDEIIERALDVAMISEKADYGTVIHNLTEPGAQGYVPEVMQPSVDAWFRGMRGWKIVATELFVVSETFGSAGTVDHVAIPPKCLGIPGLVPIDKKTGKVNLGETAIQLSGYADSVIYDHESGGTRITFEEAFGMPINLDVAFHASLPAMTDQLVLQPLDMVKGRALAALCATVRDSRRGMNSGHPKPLDLPAIAARCAWDAIEAAPAARDEFLAIRTLYLDVWTDDMSRRVLERLA